MTADEAIAMLDAQLAEHGQNIVLRRVKGGSGLTPQNVDVTCRALVRGMSPEELVGAFTQQDKKVIVSPTEIDDADWPADEADSTSQVDHRVPRKNRGDRVIFGGRTHSVEQADPIYLNSTLVRIDMVVRALA